MRCGFIISLCFLSYVHLFVAQTTYFEFELIKHGFYLRDLRYDPTSQRLWVVSENFPRSSLFYITPKDFQLHDNPTIDVDFTDYQPFTYVENATTLHHFLIGS